MTPEGWASARLGNQRAFHYYRNRKTLCGRYELIQPPPEHVTFRIPPDPMSVMFTNSSDCSVCRRKMRDDATPKPSEGGAMSEIVKSGDKFVDGNLEIKVLRVSKQGLWADIDVCRSDGWMWSKRQPLPFPASFKPAKPSEEKL